jgi:hypothetical protein
MTVSDIIKAVRLCIDEEDSNPSSLANQGVLGSDNALMNNIIKGRIGDALKWICLFSPAELLSTTESSVSGSIDIVVEETNKSVETDTNLLSPVSPLLKVVRVKGSKWHRAVLGDSLIREDSDEYLQLNDPNGAVATDDRPQAVLINTKEKKVEVWPAVGSTFTLTYAKALSSAELSSLNTVTTIVNIPVLVETSFIYYLAYLVLTAYGDARKDSMLEVAMQSLGRSQKQQ